MIRSCDEMIGYAVTALGAHAGWVKDLYADEIWHVKHLLVDTGRWLPGRKMLLPADMLDAPDWRTRSINASRALEAAVAFHPGAEAGLRSLRLMLGYQVHASDGPAGVVRDFVVTGDNEFTEGWKVELIVARLGRSGPMVGVAPDMVSAIRSDARSIVVHGDLNGLRTRPEFDPDEPVQSQVEVRLLDYRGRVVPEEK